MNNGFKPHGVVVPMVTPLTPAGGLDEPAIDRLVEFLLAGGVDGIFVLGTTGEGVAVPAPLRARLIERTAASVQRRAMVYAGIGDANGDADTVANLCFQAGADAVVAHPPISYPAAELSGWFGSLLARLNGRLVLYNMPATTNVSIPLDLVEELAAHPKVVGIKDSENDPARLAELMRRLGGRPNFSIFVGVGALMAQGLGLGAVGIVPSVANLIPDVCQQLRASIQSGDWAEAERHAARMKAVSGMYQNGRTLGQSLAALKGALHCRGMCAPHVLPPLLPVSEMEMQTIRSQMSGLQLLN